MEGSSRGFLPRLEEALELRAAWLESARIPLLRELTVAYRSLFETMTDTLAKKGLLGEDRYNYGSPGGAVEVPADSAIPEEGESIEVNRRVAAYRRRLASLVDELPSTLASMDPAELSRIAGLLSYVDWGRFGEGSRSPTTRALARRCAALRAGRDQISAQVVQEVQADLEETSRGIHGILGEIEGWHRERWKADVRSKVLPQILPRLTGAEEERVAETVLISEAFPRALPNAAWHPELIHEILAEDQEKLLAALRIPAAPAAAAQPAADLRPALWDALRDICRTARDIGYCMEVLTRNERALERPRIGFLRRLWRWMRRGGTQRAERLYTIESRPSPGAPAVAEAVDFPRFIGQVQELRIMLVDVGKPGARGHRRIHAMDVDQLLDFLDVLLREVRQAYRRMEGLNTVFQARAAGSREGAARGIRLELLTIENAMKRAETARRDIVDRMERESTVQH